MSQSFARDTSVRIHPSVRVTDEPAPPQPRDSRTDAVVVPRRHTLDGFVDAVSQADAISLTDVDAFAMLVVRTDNSVYQITVLQPYAREVLVQAGAFFPERTRACLSGSSFGGSCLRLGWVGVGLHMEFHAEDQWVITSHVQSIAVASSATAQAC